MKLKQEIEKWLKETGIDQLQPYDTGEIGHAINAGKDLSSMEASEVDEVMIVLANYRLTLAYKMGLCFARVKALECTGPRDELIAQRAKLNIIKPWHDAIEAKMAVLKKIHDRKVREGGYAASSGR
jgi:hypothetical protein